MQRVATPAERILFVDNDPENVCRAQATGMQGICFVGQAELKGALSSYGIRL
jgi:FMN phosphatase YigB (HAD superfamily)